MLIEYPCNQIPLDWRMLPFDLLVTVGYGVVNFFVCLFTYNDPTPIYDQLDWINTPGKAFTNFFIILLIQVVVFTLQWLLTEKVKLPKYRATAHSSSKSLRFKTTANDSDQHRVNETEALDRGNESTRYVGGQSPLMDDNDEESPAGSLKTNSLRQSIGSTDSKRSKKNKYNPY